MVQALYRKWRPQTFDEVVGQGHVVRTLRNALTSDRVHHAYLFTGPRGTGKTTSARLLAKAVNCLAENSSDRPCNACDICLAINDGRLMDLIEIDAASNTGVDNVRDLRERVGFRPNLARYKVYVIDEVHMLSTQAFNALLKTLEEPPPHAIFVLATTEPDKIPATILSRCQRFDFRRIPLEKIVDRLEAIARKEGIQIDREALIDVARQSTGSLRDAESLLDKLAVYNEGGITVEEVRAALGTGAQEAVTALVDALAEGDVAGGLTLINETVAGGSDPRQFARQVVQHLRTLLLIGLGAEATLVHVPQELQRQFSAQAAQFDSRGLAQAVRLFTEAASEARAAWQPQLPLELAFVEAALPASNPAPAQGPARTRTAEQPKARQAQPKPSPSKEAAQPAPVHETTSPPVATPRPSPPPEPPAPRAAAVTLSQINDLWPELLGAVRRQDHKLEALLRDARIARLEGDVLIVDFKYEFHQNKVSEDRNRRLVEDVLGKLSGHRFQVRCELAQASSPASQPGPPPARQPVEEDGLIQEAVEKLGAQVRDVEKK
jgi:DNA polymerase-3 subunit gamma/tau